MTDPQPDVEQETPELVEMPRRTTAVIKGEVPMEQLPEFFDRSFGRLSATLAAQGIEPRSAALALYRGAPTDVARLEVGFVTEDPVEVDDDVVPGRLPRGRVARTVHQGSYEGLGQAWDRLATWVADQGLTAGEVMWEVYLIEPSPDMDPAELLTELNLTLA
jgi:effector-binding domain-containing protein